ncbi:hypothetical protein ACWG0P_14140 [Amedibacillus sp. YH-ame6]
MSINDMYKKEDGIYLPFEKYAELKRVRYNKDLFKNDIMYFCKIWKAHRQSYLHLCEAKGYKNDFQDFENKLFRYEDRIKKAQSYQDVNDSEVS